MDTHTLVLKKALPSFRGRNWRFLKSTKWNLEKKNNEQVYKLRKGGEKPAFCVFLGAEAIKTTIPSSPIAGRRLPTQIIETLGPQMFLTLLLNPKIIEGKGKRTKLTNHFDIPVT